MAGVAEALVKLSWGFLWGIRAAKVYCTQTQTHSCSFLFHRIPLCALINQHLSALARKFPDVKFIKAISTTCIPNYPDRNLPTIFVYLEGDIKAQFIGPLVFGGMNLTLDGKDSSTREGWGGSASAVKGACFLDAVGWLVIESPLSRVSDCEKGRTLNLSS